MNKHLVLIALTSLMTLPCFAAEGAHEEVEGLNEATRARNQQLERENRQLKQQKQQLENEKNVRIIAEGVTAYGNSLRERWNKPETEEAWKARMDAAYALGKQSNGDFKEFDRIKKAGYKKSWGDRNPLRRDFAILLVGVATVGGVVWLASRNK